MLLALLLAQWDPLGPYVCAPQTGQGIVYAGQLYPGNYGADHTFTNRYSPYPRGGYRASFLVCDSMSVGITDTGDIHFGQGRDLACYSDAAAGSLVDLGPGGHVALRRGQPGQYLAIRGTQGSNVWAVQPDGGAPECSDAGWTFMTDAGCRYRPSSGHGSNDFGDDHPMWQGQIAEFSNPLSGTGARTDHVAYVHARTGGLWQNHGLTLETAPPPGDTIETSQGTFFVDAPPGLPFWDKSRRSWFFMKPGEDAGWVKGHNAGYVKFAEQPSVDVLVAVFFLLEARLAEVEARCP